MDNPSRLKLAIQKSGRLTDQSIDLLARCGLKFSRGKDQLVGFGENMPLDLLFVRDDDIPDLVEEDVCDLGLVGLNVVEEKRLELAARGHLGEQFLDLDPCTRRQRSGAFLNQLPMVDHPAPAILGTAHAAFDRELCNAGDRRQRLAAKAQSANLLDRVVGQLGRSVPLESQHHFFGRHAAAIIYDFELAQAAIDQLHRDATRARVDRVFDQFLDCSRWPFDYFTGGNPVD